MKVNESRISKLFSGIIAGKDIADLFKDGHVYSLKDVMGVIMIEDLGECEIPDGWQFSQIMMDGRHLLTKEEYKRSESRWHEKDINTINPKD